MLPEAIQKFESEIVNLARLIKIFQAIALSKERCGSLKYESFFGFLQSPNVLVNLIITGGLKILDAIKGKKGKGEGIALIINKVLDTHESKELVLKSQIQSRWEEIDKLLEPTKIFRNKRYAHLDSEEITVENISLELRCFYIALVNLYNSLIFISFHMQNLDCIREGKWNDSIIQDHNEETIQSSALEQILLQDPTLIEFNLLLKEIIMENPVDL